MPRKLWLTAYTQLRQTTGMDTTSSITRSFMRMKRAARLTGSSSVRACCQSLQLYLDPEALQSLPDDGLRLLADQVGTGLVHDLHATAPLDAHAVTPTLPAGLLQQLGGLIEIE